MSDTADRDPGRLQRLRRRTGRPVMHRRTLTSFVARLARAAALKQIRRDVRANMSLGDTGSMPRLLRPVCVTPDLHRVPGNASQRGAVTSCGMPLFSGVLKYAGK